MVARFKRTTESFIEEFNSISKGEFVFLKEEGYVYKTNKDKISILHNTCGNIYTTSINHFLVGKCGGRCGECGKKKRGKGMSHDEFLARVENTYGDEYTILGNYETTHMPIKIKHNTCGHIWDTTAPYDFLKKNANTCPKCCGYIFQKKSHEDFVEEIRKNGFSEKEYTVLSKYNGVGKKISLLHNNCNKVSEVSPSFLLRENNPQTCKFCNEKNQHGRGVSLIEKYLKDQGIKFEMEKTFPTLKRETYLRLDFYIEELKLAIEYDGEHHYKVKYGEKDRLTLTAERDRIKNDWCKKEGIFLIRIPYWKHPINFLEEALNDYRL